MTKIDVVRNAGVRSGISTKGIVRDTAFDLQGITVGRSRIAAAASSAWHHHGARELYGFLVLGRLHLEYGPHGGLDVELDPGDFFHIPKGLVHRDVNPTDQESLVVNVLVGHGPPVVNVSDPDDSPGRAVVPWGRVRRARHRRRRYPF